MIRIGMSQPFSGRLRSRWFGERLYPLRDVDKRETPVPFEMLDLALLDELANCQSAGASQGDAKTRLEGALHRLDQFEDRFDEVVDILCAAARFGITESLRADFTVCHRQLAGSYPAVAGLLTPYFKDATRESPFQRIVSSASLDELLDDLCLVETCISARNALGECRTVINRFQDSPS